MASIFLSYRRADASGHAGRLYDHLSAYFGRESLFYDLGSVRPGSEWEAEIVDALGRCKAVLVLVSKDWMTDVQRPASFVRRELCLALARSLPIFPLLIAGVDLTQDGLPDDLRPILKYQALRLPDENFLYEKAVQTLCLSLDQSLGLGGIHVRRQLDEGLRLLEAQAYGEAKETFRAAAQEKAFAHQANLYMAVTVLAGRPVDALKPSERKELEGYLSAAHRLSSDWLPPLVLFGILEIDYYGEHGMVSDNRISVGEVARRLRSSPQEDELGFLRFVPASPQARRELGIAG